MTSRVLAGALLAVGAVASGRAEMPGAKPREAVSSLIPAAPRSVEKARTEPRSIPSAKVRVSVVAPAPTPPSVVPPSLEKKEATSSLILSPPRSAVTSLQPVPGPASRAAEKTEEEKPALEREAAAMREAHTRAKAEQARAAEAAIAKEAEELAQREAKRAAQAKAAEQKAEREREAAAMREAQAKAEQMQVAEAARQEAARMAEAKAAEERAAQEREAAARHEAEIKAEQMRAAEAAAAKAKAEEAARQEAMRVAQAKAAEEEAAREREAAVAREIEAKAQQMRVAADAAAAKEAYARAEAARLAEARSAELRAAEMRNAERIGADTGAREERPISKTAKATPASPPGADKNADARAPEPMQLAKADSVAPIAPEFSKISTAESDPPASFPPSPQEGKDTNEIPQVAPPAPVTLRGAQEALRAAEVDESLAAEVTAILAPKQPRISPPAGEGEVPRPSVVRLPSEVWLLQACESLKRLPPADQVVAFQGILRRYKKMRSEEETPRR